MEMAIGTNGPDFVAHGVQEEELDLRVKGGWYTRIARLGSIPAAPFLHTSHYVLRCSLCELYTKDGLNGQNSWIPRTCS